MRDGWEYLLVTCVLLGFSIGIWAGRMSMADVPMRPPENEALINAQLRDIYICNMRLYYCERGTHAE